MCLQCYVAFSHVVESIVLPPEYSRSRIETVLAVTGNLLKKSAQYTRVTLNMPSSQAFEQDVSSIRRCTLNKANERNDSHVRFTHSSSQPGYVNSRVRIWNPNPSTQRQSCQQKRLKHFIMLCFFKKGSATTFTLEL